MNSGVFVMTDHNQESGELVVILMAKYIIIAVYFTFCHLNFPMLRQHIMLVSLKLFDLTPNAVAFHITSYTNTHVNPIITAERFVHHRCNILEYQIDLLVEYICG